MIFLEFVVWNDFSGICGLVDEEVFFFFLE